MKKFTFCIIILVSFAAIIQAQIIPVPRDTLYDQTQTPSGTLRVSAYFTEIGYPTPYVCRAADDFTCSDQWTITKVMVLGGYFNGSQFPQSFGVHFYTDDNPDGNFPGTEIYNEYYQVNYSPPVAPDTFSIDLDEPVVLEPGHYWITVDASVATGYAEWGWKPSTGPYSYEAVWRNPPDGFETGYTTWTPITTVWPGNPETDFSFALYGINGIPASNPEPADGENAVDLDQDISWTTPSNAVSVNIYWGTEPDNLTSIYSGPPISTFDQGTMEYATDYYWRVDVNDGDGTATGWTWQFSTIEDPSIVLNEDFESYYFPPDGWVVQSTGDPLWSQYFGVSAFGQGDNSLQAEFFLHYPVDSIGNIITYTFYPLSSGDTLTFDHAYAPDYGGNDDQLEIFYSTNAGTTWDSLVLLHGGTNGELVTAPPTTLYFVPESNQWGTMKFAVPEGTNRFLFKAIDGHGNNLYLDNIRILTANEVPVELVSFTGTAQNGDVTLNWTTATETNNSGFEIQRKPGSDSKQSEWEKIGFVKGRGTTTEKSTYSYKDQNLKTGSYSYRLKQTDLDGGYHYSKTIETEVTRPAEFSLKQNYPNPFNPSTKIKFSLSTDSKVTLSVFNILGQKVKTLINGNLSSGEHNVTFDASALNSGVYFYRIEAEGNDGENFSAVKKMILTK